MRYGGRRLCTMRRPVKCQLLTKLIFNVVGIRKDTDVKVDIESFHVYLSMRSQSHTVNAQQCLDITLVNISLSDNPGETKERSTFGNE